MKYVFLLSLALFLFTSCDKTLDPSKVPAAVTTSFNEKYPGAENVEWEMDGQNYEAEFKLNNEKVAAEFSPEGAFIKEE
jgi:hypothetical protein